jgi:MinD-like ATPase involved in chromosome partitioning or flagellar assembly
MPRILSVHSFRRGTGKSTIAANLSILLALAGYRIGIIDTDLAAPSAHLFFGLNTQRGTLTLNDYLLGACPIEDAAHDVTERWRIANSGRLYVIPASDSASQIADVMRQPYDVDSLSTGLERLLAALALDMLVIDTRAGLNDDSLMTFAISDVLAVILRPDRYDYQGTAVVLDLARRLEVPRVALVVNQVAPGYNIAGIKAEVEQSYQCEVAAALPYSPELASVAGAGIFALSYPQHPLTALLKQLANAVAVEGK